jgi:hypothetical protein
MTRKGHCGAALCGAAAPRQKSPLPTAKWSCYRALLTRERVTTQHCVEALHCLANLTDGSEANRDRAVGAACVRQVPQKSPAREFC